MSLSEKDFAETYLQLLSDSPIKIDAHFKADLNDVSTLLKLPNLPVAKVQATTTTVKAHFKSIKAPKFVHEGSFNSSDTIAQVKEHLIEQVPELKGYNASKVKFLIGGKVAKDSALLGAEEVKFTVMLSGTPVLLETDKSEKEELLDDEVPEVVLDEEWEKVNIIIPWDKIASVLEESGLGDGVLKRLQRGWELTE